MCHSDQTWCPFYQRFTYEFFVQTLFRQLFPHIRNVHVTRKKVAELTFVQKTRAYKVDEIDTYPQ